MSKYGHTVVQHSGFGYAGDPTFEAALESRGVTNAKERNAITKAGGVIFDTYEAAEDFAYDEQYPPDNHSIVPSVPGTFVEAKVDGLRIYVPVKVDA